MNTLNVVDRLLADRSVRIAVLGGAMALVLGLGPSGPHPGFGLVAAASAAPQDATTDEARGQAALAEARTHMDAGRWNSAAAKYAEAVRYLPGNDEAIKGQAEAETLLNRGSTIADVEQTTQVLREQIRVEFDDAMARSGELMRQGNFDQATRAASSLAMPASISQRRSESFSRAAK